MLSISGSAKAFFVGKWYANLTQKLMQSECLGGNDGYFLAKYSDCSVIEQSIDLDQCILLGLINIYLGYFKMEAK